MFFVPPRPTDMGPDFAEEMPDGADRFRNFLRIFALGFPRPIFIRFGTICGPAVL